MPAETVPARHRDPVKQFSVFTPNRLGRLHDLLDLLRSRQVHVLALTVLDSTDSSIIRLVVDDPDQAREMFRKHDFAFTESDLVVVEVDSVERLNSLMDAMLEAEVNINYLYSFIPQTQGRSVMAMSLEDNELAEEILATHQFRVLRQIDISR